MKVAIIYYSFLDKNGVERRVGGVETYILNLGNLCAEMGWTPLLFQLGNRAFTRNVGSLRVTGVPVAGYRQKTQRHKLFAAALQEIDLNKDILIFGADQCTVPVRSPRCIAVQHGVSWDLPVQYAKRRRIWRSYLGQKLAKRIMVKHAIRNFENCQNRVCVDYNFLNWYRTALTREVSGKVWVILNATPLAERGQAVEREDANGCVRVLFARRFEQYRGTRIMAEVIRHILRNHANVHFTLAGEGPDEEWLRRTFSAESRVAFDKYVPGNAIAKLLDHDIAVVPSIASEGSSISVAEGMAAGRAVVATAVGGVTNMITNNYNGLLVMPDAKSLLAGLSRVIEDRSLRRELAKNAYHTAQAAFGIEKWKASWRAVLEEVAQG